MSVFAFVTLLVRASSDTCLIFRYPNICPELHGTTTFNSNRDTCEEEACQKSIALSYEYEYQDYECPDSNERSEMANILMIDHRSRLKSKDLVNAICYYETTAKSMFQPIFLELVQKLASDKTEDRRKDDGDYRGEFFIKYYQREEHFRQFYSQT